MKIGIITFHHTTNYGATLQAYALWEAIKDQGHNVEIIDYRPSSAVKHYRKKIFRPVEVRGKKNSVISFMKYFLPSLKKYVRMRKFLTSRIKLSRTISNSSGLPSLFEAGQSYDAVVSGSDQVWCTISIRGFDPSYFLDFIPDEAFCKKLSYAASLGPSSTFGANQKEVAALVGKFDSVAVRDSNSRGVVERECQVDAVKVLDPTFLSNFEAIIPNQKNREAPYLLLYFEKDMLAEEKRLVKAIAKDKGLKIISIADPCVIADKIIMDLSPEGWLFYYRHASYVVTNFYHGTIFSIKFNKQFTTLARPSKMNKTKDLLSALDLTERLVTKIDDKTLDEQLSPIDYPQVNEKVSLETSKSKAYLTNALKN